MLRAHYSLSRTPLPMCRRVFSTTLLRLMFESSPRQMRSGRALGSVKPSMVMYGECTCDVPQLLHAGAHTAHLEQLAYATIQLIVRNRTPVLLFVIAYDFVSPGYYRTAEL